jgi:PTS system mannose-specific IIB component/fructoselysine and glucoselysine-specific PTS system IIB component
MPIVLQRVDERLIHGQVVLGWGSHLRPGRFVVVDDELADSEWEQELYRLGAGGAEVLFVTADRALRELAGWKEEDVRTVLLTRDLATMGELAGEGALEGTTINVGGIHHAPGREEVLTYVHLTEAHREQIRALEDAGARVIARDLPDSHATPLLPLVER